MSTFQNEPESDALLIDCCCCCLFS